MIAGLSERQNARATLVMAHGLLNLISNDVRLECLFFCVFFSDPIACGHKDMLKLGSYAALCQMWPVMLKDGDQVTIEGYYWGMLDVTAVRKH